MSPARKAAALPVVLALVALLAPAQRRVKQAKTLSPAAIAARASHSVVFVESGEGRDRLLGSGFPIDATSIITNAHVVRGHSTVLLYPVENVKDKYIGYVVFANVDADLALLDVPADPNRPALTLSPSEPDLGATIYAIGNPEGLGGTFAIGNVSAYRKFGDQPLMQLTAPLSPGSSGGPILDSRGLVVAVATSQFRQGEALNFGIPLPTLRDFINRERADPKSRLLRLYDAVHRDQQ